jgi:probable HAF family extracellular repeat protein
MTKPDNYAIDLRRQGKNRSRKGHWSQRYLTAAACIAFIHASSNVASPASFSGLGVLSGDTYSHASGISGDGLTVVGTSYPNSSATEPIRAFRWTASGGMVAIGDLPGGVVRSEAYDVSYDGSVIVGGSSSANSYNGDPTYYEPFRWTAAGGMQGLGFLPNATTPSGRGSGVSTDGSVVAGFSATENGPRAFRWTQAGGMINLGSLPGAGFNPSGGASDISADGSVVVGLDRISSNRTAFRWTAGTGMQSLGTLPGAGNMGRELYSNAQAVSADGLTVVGDGYSSNGSEGFRWTSAGGMVGLGDLPGGFFQSSAYGVSANGTVIVGSGNTSNGSRAFRWDPVNGMKSIEELLIAEGLASSLVGWQLSAAVDVSADGRTIVGTGDGPGGTRAWIATLTVPEPAGHIQILIVASLVSVILAARALPGHTLYFWWD